MDTEHQDAFFEGLYIHTTEPLLTPAMGRAEVEAFRALAGVEPGARILDLSCGWGRHLGLLREAGFEAMGVERARACVRRAAAQGGVARGDLRALPFADASFDAVACFYSSLFFFDEPGNQAALAEVARVLRPGARLVFQGANPLHLRRLGESAERVCLPDGSVVEESARFEVATGREISTRRWIRADAEVEEGRFFVRHYAPGEMEALGRRVGLMLTDMKGDLALSPWTRRSRELLAVLEKRPQP